MSRKVIKDFNNLVSTRDIGGNTFENLVNAEKGPNRNTYQNTKLPKTSKKSVHFLGHIYIYSNEDIMTTLQPSVLKNLGMIKKPKKTKF